MSAPGEVLTLGADETARALFRRVQERPFDVGMEELQSAAAARPGRSGGLYAGDVVEVHGENGVGKSDLLMRAVAHTVLPDPYRPGGPLPPRLAVYVDHDGKFDIERLRYILGRRLAKFPEGKRAQELDEAETMAKEAAATAGVAVSPGAADGVGGGGSDSVGGGHNGSENGAMEMATEPEEGHFETLLLNALERVWVLRCDTTFDFVASLEVLQAELRGTLPFNYPQPKCFNPRDGALMLIDSLGSFFFRDKFTELVAGEGTSLQKVAVRTLARLVQEEKRILVLAAKPVLFNPKEERGGLGSHREYMPPAWQNLVEFRVDVALKRDLPPPRSISVEMEWGTMNVTVNRFSCPLFYAAARKNAASDSGMESEPEDDSPFYDVFISKGLPGSV